MKKILTIGLMLMLFNGCSSNQVNNDDTNNQNEQKSEVVNKIENNSETLKIDPNWNIPIKGEISGVFCGFIDNHSFELLGDDGNYYAISTLKLTEENFSDLESNKTKMTIEYIIENEGSQLTLLKIKDEK